MSKFAIAISRRWALSIPVVAILALLLSLLVVQVVEREAAADRLADLHHAADAAAMRLRDVTLNGQVMGAGVLSGIVDPDLRAQVSGHVPPDDPRASHRLDQLRHMFDAANTFVVAANGTIQAYSIETGVSGTGSNVGFRPYFKRAMEGKPNVYVAVGSNNFARGAYFATPITADETAGSPAIGVLGIKLSMDAIDAVLTEHAEPALLLSPQGVVFASNRPEWLFRLAGAVTPERVATIQATRQLSNVFDVRPPQTLPFDTTAARTRLGNDDIGVAAASVDWNDPGGAWTVVMTVDREAWLPIQRRRLLWAGNLAVWSLLGLACVMLLRDRAHQLAAAHRVRTLSQAIECSPVGTVITSAGGQVEYVNPKFVETTRYGDEEITGRDIGALMDAGTSAAPRTDLLGALAEGRVWAGELVNRRRDGTLYWSKWGVSPIRDADGRITHHVALIEDVSERKAMEEQIARHAEELEAEKREAERALAQLHSAHAELNRVNGHIRESIRYASRIQSSLLPDSSALDGVVDDLAIGWVPRDVVGGDFYWTGRFGERCIVAVVDCTGHGVPGAFMTAIVASVLDRILHEHCHDDPARILQMLNALVKRTLHQEQGDSLSDDGLDAAICVIDPPRRQLTYAGARLPLIYVQDGVLGEIKGDRHSLGYRQSQDDYPFANHRLVLSPGTWFYLITDGLTDQVGGAKRLMFGRKRLSAAVLANSHLSAHEQADRVFEAVAEYRGEESQRDDMTFVAIRPLSPEAQRDTAAA